MKHLQIPLSMSLVAVAMFGSSSLLRASENDDRVESTFTKTYVYQTYLKDDAIKVSAKEGVVTLTGTVADEYHKSLAQDTAAGLPGVVRIDNQLATKSDVATENADAWIGKKVKLALLFHRHVSAGQTTVAVKAGVVSLTGVAANAAEKDLASEYAKDIEGVKEVRNEMTIAATPEKPERSASELIDDGSITAQVKAALHTHRSTSAMTTKVETKDGGVTVTGIAKNDAEKTLVTKLVTDIQGVKSVKNLMTVEEAVK